MTISNPSVRSGPYIPDGATTNFPFDFLALSAGELLVTQVQGGSEVPISGWSAVVSGEGGTVLFPVAPGIGSGPIYINANPNLVQNITANASLLPGSVSAALDRVTQIALLALATARGNLGAADPVSVAAMISAALANVQGLER